MRELRVEMMLHQDLNADLVGRAPVIIPDWQILDTFRSFVQSLGLTTQSLSSSVNPDVESLHSEKENIVVTGFYF